MKKQNVFPFLVLIFSVAIIQVTLAQQTNNQTREKGSVVYEIAGQNDIIVKKDFTYHNDLKLDIYYPPRFGFQTKLPAVIIVLGYTDEAGKKLVGSEFRSYAYFTSWSRVIAASGLAAIIYQSTDPEKDIIALLNYIDSNSDKIFIDQDRLAAFSVSAHTPTMISTSLGNTPTNFKCAAAFYGFFLTKDFKYFPQIDSISQFMGFKTPRLPDPVNWRKDLAILIIRAGKDNVPFINQSLSTFYEDAMIQNLPITLINYPTGLHGFDVYNNNETTRQIIKNTIDFWKYNLNK
jgi:dienelactone hydrolase